MFTNRNCPHCASAKISRSHRRGAIERHFLRLIGVRPFRCLDCDIRFYAFARLDEEASVNKKAA